MVLFQCLIKYYHIMFIIIFWLGCDRQSGLHFFVPTLVLSILTPLLPPSTVSLSYFVLVVPMRECLGKHSWMSSPCPIAILNGTFLFSRGEIVCLGRSFVYQNQIKLNFSISYIVLTCHVYYYCFWFGFNTFLLFLRRIILFSLKESVTRCNSSLGSLLFSVVLPFEYASSV